MKIVDVFHGKTGGGYLTQFSPPTGPITYLAITQDMNGNFKFVAAEGVNEEGTPEQIFGDPQKEETKSFLSRFRNTN